MHTITKVLYFSAQIAHSTVITLKS